jgi:nucleotide-binding universal stress UspA family protein
MKTQAAKRRTRKPVNRLISPAGVAVTTRPEPPLTARLKTIVVPIDFSAQSKNALRYAVRLAEQFGSVLRLVHVVETAPFLNDLSNVGLVRSDDEIARAAKVQLQALAQDEIEELIPIYPEVRIGKPYHEIVAVAKVSDADLIVIATHGYTGLKHAFLGSTAERVVRHAHCPVLVVREPERSNS